MWGSKLRPRELESHAPLSEPSWCPIFVSCKGSGGHSDVSGLEEPKISRDDDLSNRPRKIAETVHKAVEGETDIRWNSVSSLLGLVAQKKIDK